MTVATSRQSPCPCGSGKKYKHCCAAKGLQQAPAPAELDQLIALFNSNRFEELESRAKLMLGQYPESGIVWKLLSASLQMLGRDALSALKKTAELLPSDAEAQHNLGSALQDNGQIEAAVASYRNAIRVNPDNAWIYNSLGTALQELGQFDVAVASYRQALKIYPDYVDGHNNLGIVQNEIGQFDAAAASFRQALAIKPDCAKAHCGLGLALKNIGQVDAALASYRRALEIQPDYADVHSNMGNALHAIGQLDAAFECYSIALEIKPDHADAHANLAHLLLVQGDFGRGWQEYAWRFNRDAHGLASPQSSKSLPFSGRDKRILLCHEQGIGDELFFLRFAQRLRDEAQWLGYWPSAKLHSLIERSVCVDQVISRFDESLLVDLIIPVGDLPLLLGCCSTGDIPKALRLVPTEQHAAKAQQCLRELGLSGQRLLGVTWRAGLPPVPGQRQTLFKQVELDLLADAIKGWEGAIVVLQRVPMAGEIEQLRANVSCPVHDLSAYNNDLESMLALLDTLDEYVGVSNTNTHLMAGLGKTARVLIPFPAEWRWMASGDQSLWFPGFALYRQAVDGDWGQALAGLSRDLSGDAAR